MKHILFMKRKLKGETIKNNFAVQLPSNFRGFPEILKNRDSHEEVLCAQYCLSQAIFLNPFRIDLGKCSFCGRCAVKFPQIIRFTSHHNLSVFLREDLIIDEDISFEQYQKRAMMHLIKLPFKKSFALRNISAGGSGGCEAELNACFNINFDIGRYGIKMVASPRHADALVVTGPITTNMEIAIEKTFEAMPTPKYIILLGSEAISGGYFGLSESQNRNFLLKNMPVLYIPGEPPHPQTIIHGLLKLLGQWK